MKTKIILSLFHLSNRTSCDRILDNYWKQKEDENNTSPFLGKWVGDIKWLSDKNINIEVFKSGNTNSHFLMAVFFVLTLKRSKTHLVEAVIHLVGTMIHLVETLMHLVGLVKHLVMALRHLVEPLKHLVRPLKHLVEPLKHLVEANSLQIK